MAPKPIFDINRSLSKIGASRRKPPDPCREWRRQMALVQDFLDRLKATPTMHGKKWKDKMLAHYGHRLKDLKKARPKGCK